MDHIDTLKNIVEALEHAIKALEKEKETAVLIQHEGELYDGTPYISYECSKCHTINHKSNYCPECGVKIGGIVYACH